MPARKMRVEIFDSEGNKYTVVFEGQITRDKALRLFDLVELLGGIPSGVDNPTFGNTRISKYEKVHLIIHQHFPIVWFFSKEIQSVYEKEVKEPISLSTVATYLSRMAKRGILVNTRTSRGVRYRIAPSFPETTIKQESLY